MPYVLAVHVTAEKRLIPSGEYKHNTGLHLELIPLLTGSNRSQHQAMTEPLLDLRGTIGGFRSTRQRYQILRTGSLIEAVEQLHIAQTRLSSLLLHQPDFAESSAQRLLNGPIDEELIAYDVRESSRSGDPQYHTLSWRRDKSVVWLEGEINSWVIWPKDQTYSQVCKEGGLTCRHLADALFPPCIVCLQPSSAYGVPCTRCAVAFLMGMHERLGASSPVRFLPMGVAHVILRAIDNDD